MESDPSEGLSGVSEPAVIELAAGRPTLSVQTTNRLLRRQGLAPLLARALTLETVATTVSLSEEEERALLRVVLEQERIESEQGLESWLEQRRWTFDDLRASATLPERLERYCHSRYGDEAEIRFLDRKLDLDLVTYSLLRVSDSDQAEELYFRLREDEARFEELVESYSEGDEKATHGLIGPIAVTAAHPDLATRLRIGTPGQLWPPFAIGSVWLIVRLENRFPAELDEPTRRRMEAELFELWVNEQVEQLMNGEAITPPSSPVNES